MKTNQRLHKTIKAGIFAAALFCSSSVFAQVKIGSNPTVINAANNLEVEASTAGNKVSVDKVTGKVTIADGSQGSDKVLTSDATGIATWQKVAPANITQFPKGRLSGGLTPDFVGLFQIQDVAYATTSYLEAGVTRVGNGLKVPVSGYYSISSQNFFQNKSGCTGITLISSSANLYINGVQSAILGATQNTPRYAGGWTTSFSNVIYLNANDVINVKGVISLNAPQAGCLTDMLNSDIVVSYQP